MSLNGEAYFQREMSLEAVILGSLEHDREIAQPALTDGGGRPDRAGGTVSVDHARLGDPDPFFDYPQGGLHYLSIFTLFTLMRPPILD